MNINNHSFEGPYDHPNNVPSTAGVYVPMDFRGGQYFVTDVGETGDLRARLSSHERAECWRRHTRGQLRFFVLRMPGSSPDQRRWVEKGVRDNYRPPCGDI